jgi:2,4-dienoyl-CoA reductase-like NADH-dependent reductase (Old Yellow Enzyme family)/thioredoxin reductase
VSELSHLFAPIEVGRMTVKNRLVMAPMERNYANRDGTVSARTTAHYEARARGGVGWIDVEATYVDPVGRGRAFQLGIDRDECVEGFRELVDVVHAHGAKIGIELQHSGRCTSRAISGFQPVAPSPVPEPVAGGDVPRELTVDEIRAIIAQHGHAARRAAEAGFDALELHSAHGYLPFAFLSPMTNHRTDEYGGSFENRLRLSLELVEAFRDNAPDHVTIGCRFTADEFQAGGIGLEDAVRYSRALEEAGVEYLSVSAGVYATWERTIPGMDYSPGWLIGHAATIKDAVAIPVIGVSRFTDPRDADRVIGAGKVDLVVFGRALLADPELPRKAEEGRLDEIVSCIGVNTGCIVRMAAQRDVTCVVNPATGREGEFGLEPAPEPKRVLVVGGGPAGMEAATVAAERGHQVSLVERDDELGGLALLAGRLPHRGGWMTFVREATRRLERAGVEVQLGREVGAEDLRDAGADAVVLATGSEFARPEIPGGDEAVLDAAALLAGGDVAAEHVVVAGDGAIGLGVAEWLAERGKQVSVVIEQEEVEDPDGQAGLVERLGASGRVGFHTDRMVRELRPGSVVIVRSGAIGALDEEELEGAEAVVLAGARRATGELAWLARTERLADEVHAIGDCDTPRSVLEAVAEGALVGRRI